MEADANVCVVDDDPGVVATVSEMIATAGWGVRSYPNGSAFLDALETEQADCVVLDVRLPDISGLAVQNKLRENDCVIPLIFISGYDDVPVAVSAMKAGAFDFLTKPVGREELLASIDEAIQYGSRVRQQQALGREVRKRMDILSRREREVLRLMVTGRANKQIAADLGLSTKTVEAHRANVKRKMRADTVAELVQMTIAAFPADALGGDWGGGIV